MMIQIGYTTHQTFTKGKFFTSIIDRSSLDGRLFFLTICPILILLQSCAGSRNIVLGPHNVQLINRNFVSVEDRGGMITVDSQKSAGLIIIRNLAFDTGVLEVDFKGENKQGASFLGLAFNIQNDSTYECVYFRPFNFRSEEKVRREHSIQYIFHPEYPWHRLREDQPDKFEAEYPNSPDPDDWFTIRLKIGPDSVEVYDKKFKRMLLKVERLAGTTSSKIGFWTGSSSSGNFRNLNLIRSKTPQF
ncbi:MAG: hypothetical protein IPL46_28365 [Saprospiraceae bacterium]|nr:hypothetical protein [Saprospiraceae bacterium]